MDTRDRAAGIRLMAFDIDGVMTDGGLHYTDDGGELKTFNVQDGFGLKLLQKAGKIGTAQSVAAVVAPGDKGRAGTLDRANAPAPRTCGSCETINDPDARFCKRCGSSLVTVQ